MARKTSTAPSTGSALAQELARMLTAYAAATPTPESEHQLVRARARLREALSLVGATAPAPAPVAPVPAPVAPAPAPAPTPAPAPAPAPARPAGASARLPMRECDNATLVNERMGEGFPTVKRKIAVGIVAKRLTDAHLIAETEAREIVRLAGKDVAAAEARVTALVTGAEVAGIVPAPVAVPVAPEGEVASEFANL